MNKLQPSGPSTCFPAALATAAENAGFAKCDAVKGDVYCDNGDVGVAAGAGVNWLVRLSAPGPNYFEMIEMKEAN